MFVILPFSSSEPLFTLLRYVLAGVSKYMKEWSLGCICKNGPLHDATVGSGYVTTKSSKNFQCTLWMRIWAAIDRHAVAHCVRRRTTERFNLESILGPWKFRGSCVRRKIIELYVLSGPDCPLAGSFSVFIR